MKSKFIGKLLLLVLLVAGGLMYMGCSTSNSDTPILLSKITITPSLATIAVGSTEQFSAECKDVNNMVVTCPKLTWSSKEPSVATIDASAGVATGVSAGTVAITAAANSGMYMLGTATLTVQNKITITPSTPTITINGTQQFTATCTGNGGSCPTLTWSSDNTNVAAVVSSTGVATGVAAGTTTITASAANYTSGTATLTVTNPLKDIVITPTAPPPTINIDGTTQFSAACTDTTNASMTCPTLTWLSENTNVAAVVSSTGVATGVNEGTTIITANAENITSNSVTLTVSPNAPTLSSIAVTPIPTPSITPGGTQQFTATGTYSDDTTQNITNSVTWASGTTSVATIVQGPPGTNPGLATGVAGGNSTITATLGDISGTSTLTVIPTYTIGGAVTGLRSGQSVVLQNNGGNNFTVTNNTSDGYPNFTFSTALTSGTAYSVTILTQPNQGHCDVSEGGSGTVGSANIINVQVQCY